MAQRYDTYKDSGVQWLGEIPGHWRCASMNKAIFDIRTGLNPRVHFMLNTEDANCYYVTIRELRGFDIITDSSTDRINNQAVERIPPLFPNNAPLSPTSASAQRR